MKMLTAVLNLLQRIADHLERQRREKEQDKHQRDSNRAQERPVEWFEQHFNGVGKDDSKPNSGE